MILFIYDLTPSPNLANSAFLSSSVISNSAYSFILHNPFLTCLLRKLLVLLLKEVIRLKL